MVGDNLENPGVSLYIVNTIIFYSNMVTFEGGEGLYVVNWDRALILYHM